MCALYLLQNYHVSHGVCLDCKSAETPVGPSALQEPPQLPAAVAMSHARRNRAETSGGWPAGAYNMRSRPAVVPGEEGSWGRSMHCTALQQETDRWHHAGCMKCCDATLGPYQTLHVGTQQSWQLERVICVSRWCSCSVQRQAVLVQVYLQWACPTTHNSIIGCQ